MGCCWDVAEPTEPEEEAVGGEVVMSSDVNAAPAARCFFM